MIGKKIHSQKVAIDLSKEKKDLKKKEDKENEGIAKICNFILYEFDIEDTN